jgi:hypothetical protein
MIRSSDGKMRIDTGTTSLITDPKTQQAMVLDHVKKTASFMPITPSPPQMPQAPQAGAAPSLKPPTMPSVGVQDLGKSLIEGHEVDGKRYIVQPPQMPQVPDAPQVPQKPQAPTIADVWTSSKLGMPVLTTVSGPFGQQTSYCRAAQSGEPHPALFQMPAGYKPIMPAPSK